MNINKIVDVSISGIGFTLTETGYNTLSSYINSLRASYSKSPDAEEIVADIEARIVELILSKESAEGVISDQTIYTIIEQLGAPEVIAPGARDSSFDSSQGGRFPRRLYRNMDGAKLGGVCNGLAQFLSIDPTMVRLSMFVPLVALVILPSIGFHSLNAFLGSLFGATMLLYFVMWLVVPVARSPRQRLEMRGEKITASSIQDDANEHLPNSSQGEKSSSIFAQFFIVIGQIMLFLIKAIAILIGLSVGLCIIALVATIGIIPFVDGVLFLNYLPELVPSISIWTVRLVTMLILSICLLPLVMIAYQAFRIAFGLRNSALFMWILTGCWFVAVVILGLFTINNHKEIRESIRSGYIYERTLERIMPEDATGAIIIDGDTVLRATSSQRTRRGEFKRIIENIERADSIKSIEIKLKDGSGSGSISIEIKGDNKGEKDGGE